MPAVPHLLARPPRSFFLRGIFAVLVTAMLLTGCALGAGRAARRAAVASTSTPQPTETRVRPPTRTPEPSATLTAVPTNTEPTAAAITETPAAPTPDPALGEVKLVGLSWLEKYKYNLLLSFDFPGPVDPADYRVTLEGKEYYCEVLGQYPNRLYCNGQGAKVLAVALVQIYPAGSDTPGFEQEVWVPYFQ